MRVTLRTILGLVLYSQIQLASAEINNDVNQGPAAAAPVPKAIDFADYVRQYHKSYDQLEAVERAKLFFGRTISIFKHNVEYASQKIGHFLRQTEFIDKTPDELTEKYSRANSDFQPVEEATKWPDYPASEYYRAQKDGGYSRLSLTDAEKSHSKSPKGSPLNFLEEPVADQSASVKGEGDAKQLRLAAKLSSRLKQTGADASLEEEVQRESNGIKYEPIVRPNNANFDPSLLPSQGVLDTMHKFEGDYATFMMDDFAFNLKPYSAPPPVEEKITRVRPHQMQEPELASVFGLSLSSFVNSVKAISDYFDPSDEQMDIDEEEEAKQSDSVAPVTPPVSHTNSFIDPRLLQPITYDIDWRTTGCISLIKSQKDCNACYALATLDLMEFFYCRQKKIATEFSAQYVLDCGARSGLNGCQGGKLSGVGNFIRNFGIQLHAFYPYRARQQECPFDSQDYTKKLPYPIKPQITGWKMFTQISDWYKWLPRSPLIVGISMPADFFAYGGGVHEGTDCVPDMVHAMLLVGSGVQDGKQFWLLKNTFSYAWGENGYFRLSKQAPLKCFNSAVVARANFNVAYQ